jgi:photosystem II stability/assembly factor-like uncharacterized protein
LHYNSAQKSLPADARARDLASIRLEINMSSQMCPIPVPKRLLCATLLLVFAPLLFPASFWKGIGPEAGTIWCIAIDPQAPAVLYAGTSGGGIFKSTDHGTTWAASNRGLTDFSILTIAVDPGHTQTVYCSAANAGVFKSTDGARTWTSLRAGLPELSVSALAINPAKPEILYAGTQVGAFKTTDGGQTWTAANAGMVDQTNPDQKWVLDLAIDSRNPDIIYAGTAHHGVFKTDNGGRNWAPANTGLPVLNIDTLAIDSQDTKILYAGISGDAIGIWKSVNGGASWNPVAANGLPPFNVVASLIPDPRTPETVYAVGFLSDPGLKTGMFRSGDGGATWTALTDVPGGQIPPLAIDPGDPSTIYAGSNDSGMYKSTDAGRTWIHSSDGISNLSVAGLTTDRAHPNAVYASTSQGLFKSINGGSTWVLLLPNSVYYPVVVDPTDSDIIYAAQGEALKSTDGGQTWKRLNTPHGVVSLAIDPRNPKTLYGGESNSPLGPAGEINGVVRSDDGGESWRPANGGLPDSRVVFGILTVDPVDPTTVYAATTQGNGGLYRSTDGGANWTAVSGDMREVTTFVLAGKVMLVGSPSKGLLRSSDGGSSWISLDNMKEKYVTALAFNDATAALYAGTSDGGVFRSTDAGDSWSQLNLEISMPGVQSLTADPREAETVYAGTPGGVFKMATRDSAWKLEIPAGGAAVTSTAGTEASVQAGYATAKIVSGSAASGVAVFSFRQDGVVVSEAGVPASVPTRSARVFVEYRTGVAAPGQQTGFIDVYTGLALANAGSSDANLTYVLRNAAGRVVAVGHGALAGGSHFAKFVHQLTEEAPDFSLDDFATKVQTGSLDILSDQPVSVLALRVTVNQRNDALLTTTPTADLTEPLNARPLFFPHVVVGGGYVTRLIVLNASNAPESGVLLFFDRQGAPLRVGQAGGTGRSSVPYSIQPGAILVFQAEGSSGDVVEGSAQVVPDAETSTPSAAGVFGFSRDGVLVTESGIPAAEPTTHARIYVDESGGHGTGLALTRPPGAGMSVLLKAYQMDGKTPVGAPVPVFVSSSGHAAGFVSRMIPGIPSGFKGILDLSSDSPFAALTLRSMTNSRADFLLTTFPVLDLNRRFPLPIVFPQIADGGGYLTQFILLGGAGTANAELEMWDDAGVPLAVGKP